MDIFFALSSPSCPPNFFSALRAEFPSCPSPDLFEREMPSWPSPDIVQGLLHCKGAKEIRKRKSPFKLLLNHLQNKKQNKMNKLTKKTNDKHK